MGRKGSRLTMMVLSRRFLALVPIVALITLSGCSALDLFGSSSGGGAKQEIGKVLWESRDRYVRLESQDAVRGQPPPPNTHPVRLSPDQIRAALSKIRVIVEKGAEPMPVFTDFELKVLGKAVAAGLAQARPDQDVTFALIDFHKGDLVGFLKEPKVNTGRIFYARNQLNLIFGSVLGESIENKGRSSAAGRVEPDRRLHPLVPGMRSFTSKHSWRLVTTPGSGVHVAAGTKRSDWLIFTTQAFVAPPAAYARTNGATGGGGGGGASEVQQLRQEVDQLRRDLQGVRGGGQYPPPAYPAPQAPAAPAYQTPAVPAYQTPAPPAAGQTPGLSPSAQQRLMVLDDLRSKGLISDQEYQIKRNQILSGL